MNMNRRNVLKTLVASAFATVGAFTPWRSAKASVPAGVVLGDTPRWVKFTKNCRDFAEGTKPSRSRFARSGYCDQFSSSVNIELPPGSFVHGAKIKHSERFNPANGEYVIALDSYGCLRAECPVSEVNFRAISLFEAPPHVELSVYADVPLDTVTQGVVDVWLLLSRTV
jgi:hypothetical protein